MGRQQFAHGEQIVNHEHTFLLHFCLRRSRIVQSPSGSILGAA